MQTLILYFFSAQYALAQGGGGYTPLVDDLPEQLQTTDAVAFLIGLFTVLIMIVTILAVVWIVIGGIQYMSTDAYSGKSEGKEKIKNALVGLLLAGASWIILYTINPQILRINLTYVTTPTEMASPGGSPGGGRLGRPASGISGHYGGVINREIYESVYRGTSCFAYNVAGVTGLRSSCSLPNVQSQAVSECNARRDIFLNDSRYIVQTTCSDSGFAE